MNVKLLCLACAQANRVPEQRLLQSPKCGRCGAPLIADQPTDISFDTLQKAARTDDLPLIVDFWAAWCGPCRMMAPEFAKAAMGMKGRARFAKLDTEAFPQAGARYDIRGIPLLIAFAGGRESKRQAGMMPSEGITKWVESQLSP
ncbi:thioredoxin domain-containing protein [Flavimaricola marinus]|uniref:Thioredoxin-2 n=1 Tax=Flavimaricola marinus TaxID=1819565 RepID=A0A238LCB5_9RHOB|nr:thioredoxin domain-containing protein [Flavimaricola marinus]SMY07261.1 Thioredoxin-2 [Flavimaricola marinus]